MIVSNGDSSNDLITEADSHTNASLKAQLAEKFAGYNVEIWDKDEVKSLQDVVSLSALFHSLQV